MSLSKTANLSGAFERAQHLNAKLDSFYQDLPQRIEQLQDKTLVKEWYSGREKTPVADVYKTPGYQKLEAFCREKNYYLAVKNDFIFGSFSVEVDVAKKYQSRLQRKIERLVSF